MVNQNFRKFQESITNEIDTIKDRVRNLIGSANWAEEGRYKEAILKNVLRQFLPNNLSIGTGFILNTNNNGSVNISKQIDIMVYDNSLPLLFVESDFIVTTPGNVRAIIEVKSKLNAASLKNAISHFDSSLLGCMPDIFNKKNNLFLGLFAYDYEGEILGSNIERTLKDSNKLINHFALGKNYFIRQWEKGSAINYLNNLTCSDDFYNIYKIDNLAFSYFISNIIERVCNIQEDRDWFLFPIEGTKEIHKIKTICL